MIFDHRTFSKVSFRIPMSKECSHYLSDKQNPYPYLREGPGSRLPAAKSIQPVNAINPAYSIFAWQVFNSQRDTWGHDVGQMHGVCTMLV